MNKVILLQAWTGTEGSRRMTLPGFKKIGTLMLQGCQPTKRPPESHD